MEPNVPLWSAGDSSVSPTPDISEDGGIMYCIEEITEYLPKICLKDSKELRSSRIDDVESPPTTPQGGYEADDESRAIPKAPKKPRVRSSRYNLDNSSRKTLFQKKTASFRAKKVARRLFPPPRKVWGKKFNKKVSTSSVSKTYRRL